MKEQLLRNLFNQHKKSEEYLDTVPVDIRDVLFNNTYAIQLQFGWESMLKYIFNDNAEVIMDILFTCNKYDTMTEDEFISKLEELMIL